MEKMKINLNNSREFTRENVAKLIGSVEDTKNWQLRVTSSGTAYLSEVVGNKNLEGWRFGLKHGLVATNMLVLRHNMIKNG